MSFADRTDQKYAQFNLLPLLKQNGNSSGVSMAALETDDKPEKKSASIPAPLSNAVTPASLYSVSPASGLNFQFNAGPSVINKQLLSKLNKSLKEKQKMINAKESHLRNSTLMLDVMSPTLQGLNSSGSASDAGAQANVPLNESIDLDRADSDINNSMIGQGKDDTSVKVKGKLVAKQNSTRTDFFAAKLAIAVDDVESSDSDETFIYETNVNEYREVKSSALPSAVADESRRVPPHSIYADNSSQIHSQSVNFDTASLSGSVRVNTNVDSHVNSPTADIRREDDSYSFMVPLPQPTVTKAESIHSLQSLKYNLRNTFNTTPLAVVASRLQSVSHTSENPIFSNPYFDSQQKDSKVSSGYEKHLSGRYSVLHYADSTLMPYGVNDTLTNALNLNDPYTDGNYSYDEDDDLSVDGVSSHGDINLMCIDANTSNVLPSSVIRPTDLVSVSSKAKKNKSSTNSSKLRSTTSKLFDKKGAQPRRYSTIPDDIDIEDFDDELIYYDNSIIRFPYGNLNETSNESSSLVSGPKIPHYRSLNLNFGARKPSKNTKSQRYLSLGYVPSPFVGNKRNNIFPFPYVESQPSNLDFDEYEEQNKLGKQDQLCSKRIPSNGIQLPGDRIHLLARNSSRDSKQSGRALSFRSLMYLFVAISFILSLGFVLGFFLASTKDLSNVSIVSIENPLVSQDELVLSIVVEALNSGWFTISINELEVDIFAKSGYLEDPSMQSSLETVLLGTALSFESAVTFEGLFFHRKRSRHTGEIKLVSPGKNITGSKVRDLASDTEISQLTSIGSHPSSVPDNSEKWATISKHPFDLILRGVLKYNLPFTSAKRSVVVNKAGYVDPSVPS